MSTIKVYKAYNFRTKDPVIDELRTLMQEAYGPKLGYKVFTRVERDGGPSATAQHNWFFGKTRRPQSAAVEACGRALGYKRTWIRANGKGK